MYLEPENVTGYVQGWGMSGSCPYKFILNGSLPSGCSAGPINTGFDLPGGDIFTVPDLPNATSCQAACCADFRCQAFVYASSAPSDFLSCSAGQPCCYAKGTVPAAKPFAGLQSGVVTHPPVSAVVPPMGMRSAVPLGGAGAGALELRGDGTFHEVTIHNAHPAGGAKYGTLGDAMLGLRIAPAGSPASGAVTRAVRTQPPAYAAGQASASLAYSGTYPMSRLRVVDDALPAATGGATASVYAYSVFRPGPDPAAFAHPAVVFTLAVDATTATSEVAATLYFQLPWGGINDCDRTGNGTTVFSKTSDAANAAACAAQCAQTQACSAWTFMPAGPHTGGNTTCSLTSDAPWPRYREGYSCAVAGGWAASGDDGQGLTYVGDAHGNAGAALSPAVGDVTLRGAASSNGTGAAVTSAVADDPSALWSAFVATGSVAGAGTAQPGAPIAPVPGIVGALTASVVVPAGTVGTVSIVWSWYFPHRDHYYQTVGNGYANLWTDSADVAAELAAPGRLARVVADINAHHEVFVGPNTAAPAPAPGAGLPPSPLPAWLSDTLVNHFSHYRGMMFTSDGRLREYEANDCPDVDSVHNDYQRHLMYTWSGTGFEVSKLRQYAIGQAANADGHVDEFLGSFSLSPLDDAGGRVMADTTTLFIVEAWELWRNTGDAALLAELYPAVVRALGWQLAASEEIGLPWRLVCTYDIIDFEQYNTSAFNSFVHIAAMRAGAALAHAAGDNATATAADAAAARAVDAMGVHLWNASYSHWKAYTPNQAGIDPVMADTLYGQVVALHMGLGWTVANASGGTGAGVNAIATSPLWPFSPAAQAAANGTGAPAAPGLASIAAHLATELQRNGNPFGLRVVTGREAPSGSGSGLGVWPSTSRFAQRYARALGLPADAPVMPPTPHGVAVDTLNDVNWQGAGPDWSYVALQLARAIAGPHVPLPDDVIAAALGPAQASLGNWRDRLHDLWNVAGITTTGSSWGPTDNVQGQPYVTSHYGFLLVDFYLLPALTGQQQDLSGSTPAPGSAPGSPPGAWLAFDPVYPCPYTLPLLVAGTEGVVACQLPSTPGGGVQYTVALMFGSLQLPAGGLSVAGSPYPQPVDLGPGQSVTWVAQA